MADALSDLIETLEKLEKPDREADAELALMAMMPQEVFGDEFGTSSVDGPNYFYGDAVWAGGGQIWHSPDFTASLDAAIALVERVLPDHRWLIDKRPFAKDRHDGYRATCYRQGHPYKSDGSDTPSAWAPTPALALLTALLRAKSALTDAGGRK